jgi:hypothetical protein
MRKQPVRKKGMEHGEEKEEMGMHPTTGRQHGHIPHTSKSDGEEEDHGRK